MIRLCSDYLHEATRNLNCALISAIFLFFSLVIFLFSSTMPSNEYDAEATELLETYGAISLQLTVSGFELIFADFLMKYIIIGIYCLFTTSRCFSTTLVLIGEAGTGKSCLLHHFTHNSCSSMYNSHIHFVHYTHIDKSHSQHTIGVEFSSRTVKLGEKRIKLQVK